MATTKRRCTACKGYFPAEEMLRASGLTNVCSHSCLETFKNKYRKKRERRQEHRENKHRYGRRLPGQIRDKVRERDGIRCRFCGKNSEIQIHHIQYRSQGGSDAPWNLISLCADHHLMVHGDKKRWQRVLQMTIWLHEAEGMYCTVPQVERAFRAAFDVEAWLDPFGDADD